MSAFPRTHREAPAMFFREFFDGVKLGTALFATAIVAVVAMFVIPWIVLAFKKKGRETLPGEEEDNNS